MAVEANQYAVSRTVECVCGVSFTRRIYQLLPDSATTSQCNYNCATGLQDGSCTLGQNCCGSGTTYAYYRNPNFLGCYEPPIPGTRIGSATYPAACFTSVQTHTISTMRSLSTGTSTVGYPVIATTPNSHPWGFPAYPQYNYMGCFSNATLQPPIIANATSGGTYSMHVAEDCMAFCAAAGTTYAAMTNNRNNPAVTPFGGM